MGEMPTLPPTGAGSGAYPLPAPQVAYIIKPRPRWRALRTIAGVFKVLAWMSAGLGVIAVLFALIQGGQIGNLGVIGGLLLVVASLIGAGTVFLLLYGRAEQILLFIAIEENTRKL